MLSIFSHVYWPLVYTCEIMSVQLLCTFLIVALVFCYWTYKSSLYIPTLLLYILNINSLCCCLITKSCPTLCNPMDGNPPGFSVQRILQARISEVSCCFLLQEIFLTQMSNPSLSHWQPDSLPLSHQGSPGEQFGDPYEQFGDPYDQFSNISSHSLSCLFLNSVYCVLWCT